MATSLLLSLRESLAQAVGGHKDLCERERDPQKHI
jgi:hypothetical protein